MALIDKDQVKAEIERRKELLTPHKGQGVILCQEIIKQFDSLLSFIDTISQPIMKNDIIGEIRAEIERRFSEYNHDSNHHIQAAECASILDFLDSLPEQPKLKPMNIPSAGSGAMGTTPPKFKLDVKPEQEDILIINKKEWEAQERFRKNKKFGQPLPEQPVDGLEGFGEKTRNAEVVLNGHGLLVDVTKWADGYKLKVIVKDE